MKYLSQLEKVLESSHRLIAVESDEPDRVCDLLLKLSRFSTRPYYLVAPQQAMYRLGVSHVQIPRTQTAAGLIEHIDTSKHFGVFILRNYNDILEDDKIVQKLIKITTAKTDKIIIMLAKNVTLPDKLKPFVVRSKHEMKNTG